MLEPVAPARWEGRPLTDLTSGEPARARSMAGWATAHGIRYLDGAILAPTQVVGTAAATVPYSGAHEVHEAVRNTMAAVRGTGRCLGADPGRAAAYEVALLDLFTTSAASPVGRAPATTPASAPRSPPRRRRSPI